MIKEDLTGRRFGILTVIRKICVRKGKSLYECKCDCGTTTETTSNNLKRIKSCGCLHIKWMKENMRTHGGNVDPEKKKAYSVWNGVKTRCYNSRCKEYKYYGGRGILMSNKWRYNFLAFFKDMGEPPTPLHELERKNNNKGYNKRNCYWATKEEQSVNKCWSIKVEYKGEILPLIEVSKRSGINYWTLHNKAKRNKGIPNYEYVKPRSKVEISIEDVRTLFEKGRTAKEIAEDMGVKENYIRYRIKRYLRP